MGAGAGASNANNGAGSSSVPGAAGAVVSAGGAPGSAGTTAEAGASVAGGAIVGSSGSVGTNAGAGAPSAGAASAGAPGAPSGGAPGAAGGGAAGSSVVVDPACKLSTPVSFKKDIEPFLLPSCGNAGGRSGCHVTDASSTVNSKCPDGTMKCGFDHAYDWITAGVHNQFCNQTPAPIRFSVVMAVVKAAKPPSCSGSRVMPPTGAPLTACQMNALEAWLAEPKVLQLHRADDTSPAAAYMMPPYN